MWYHATSNGPRCCHKVEQYSRAPGTCAAIARGPQSIGRIGTAQPTPDCAFEAFPVVEE